MVLTTAFTWLCPVRLCRAWSDGVLAGRGHFSTRRDQLPWACGPACSVWGAGSAFLLGPCAPRQACLLRPWGALCSTPRPPPLMGTGRPSCSLWPGLCDYRGTTEGGPGQGLPLPLPLCPGTSHKAGSGPQFRNRTSDCFKPELPRQPSASTPPPLEPQMAATSGEAEDSGAPALPTPPQPSPGSSGPLAATTGATERHRMLGARGPVL